MLSNHHLAFNISQSILVNFCRKPVRRLRKSEQAMQLSGSTTQKKPRFFLAYSSCSDMTTVRFRASRWNLNGTGKESRNDYSEVKKARYSQLSAFLRVFNDRAIIQSS